MICIDTKGLKCPQPLIKTKKVLIESIPGTEITILTDNQTAYDNLSDYLGEMGITFSKTWTENEGRFLIIRPESLKNAHEPNCNIPNTSKSSQYIVVMKSECMGIGDDKLGKLLIRSFLNTLKEADKLPDSIVLYNGGVKLAIEGTDTSETLSELEMKGVNIIACGTCADYYEVKNQICVGTISNMYKITEVLTQASTIVYP